MKTTIADIQKKYAGQIDRLDLELLIADAISRPREFVLIHPEYELPPLKIKNLKLKITRRMRDEPLAYILGSREFFGLPFMVTPATLIPRPETELMIEEALQEMCSKAHMTSGDVPSANTIIDVGTGSGNIIISIATNCKLQTTNYLGIDLSAEALKIAKKNAKANGVEKKIKFLQGNLLEPLLQNSKFDSPAGERNHRMVILANLPYLSKGIYDATHPTVKKFEPRSALYSAKEGLAHYEKLLQQLQQLQTKNYPPRLAETTARRCEAGKQQTILYMEISPEQRTQLPTMIKKYLPGARIEFKKDLAQKWRICKVTL